MLTVEYIRNNMQAVKDAAAHKNRVVDIEGVIRLDDERKSILQKTQTLRQERNLHAKQKPDETIITRGKEIKQELKALEERLATVELELHTKLSFIPNVPLADVPIGKDESGNKELRTHGSIPHFDFPPKSYLELGSALDLIDLERGSKVSGFRGYFLKNQAAVLHIAILLYAFNALIAKGHIPLIAPAIVRGFTLFGSGQFPWGEQEVYTLDDTDAYVAGTAEVPVTAYFAKEILLEKDLPKKFVAFSPCFRKEAGAYGKDTKGLYRVHEFWKVEQVVIMKPNLDEAIQEHEQLQKNTEALLEALEIPYRVLFMCTGDMGEPQIKKYDTEAWIPSRNKYGEIASNSIMGDFQARRLQIKYRKPDGSTDICYTLNNTAIASPRLLIALLENHQQKDGSVNIPKVLQPYTGFDHIGPAAGYELLSK